MSTDRDTTRIVRSWLQTDEYESADRVLDAVLDQLDTTPQRRATWWPARRLPQMNNDGASSGLLPPSSCIAALLGYSSFRARRWRVPAWAIPRQRQSRRRSRMDGQDPLQPGRTGRSDTCPRLFTIDVPDGWAAGKRGLSSPRARGPGGNGARFYVSGQPLQHASRMTRACSTRRRRDGRGPRPAIVDQTDGRVDADRHDGRRIPGPADRADDPGRQSTSPDEHGAFYLFGTTSVGCDLWRGPWPDASTSTSVDVDGNRVVIDGLYDFPGTTESDLRSCKRSWTRSRSKRRSSRRSREDYGGRGSDPRPPFTRAGLNARRASPLILTD